MDQSAEIYRLDTPSLYVGVLVLVGLSAFAAGAIAGLIVDLPNGALPNPWGLLVGMPTIAGLALAASLLARRARALSRLAHRLAKAARTDDLTGLANRRETNQVLEVEVARSLRYGHRLSCLLLDIDHFKQVNDRFGHVVGDQVLVEVASRLGAAVRREDVVGRWGGEEFFVILPHTDSFGARRVAEKLRQTIADTPVWIDGTSLRVTISIGLAELGALDPKRADILLQAADQALYEAKARGRNRVAA
jgi:diguanylate cyclase (GGDEF)-like protein